MWVWPSAAAHLVYISGLVMVILSTFLVNSVRHLTLKALKSSCISHGDKDVFYQFEMIINVLVTVALSASFQYICYRSTAIINF